MSARGSNERPGRPRRIAVEETKNKTGRRAPRTPRVTVTDPRIAVVESSEMADPGALDAALELLVKWALRAQKYAHPAATEAPEAPSDHKSAAYTREN